MQKRYQQKGAEKITCCALFLQETDGSWKEEEVGPGQRQKLRALYQSVWPDLLVIGYPGLQTAALLLQHKKEELTGAFPAWLLGQVSLEKTGAGAFAESCQKSRADIGALLSRGSGHFALSKELPPLLFQASEHGVFGALWELGETLGCGMEAELLQIPMKQSVVEVLGHYQLNPYELPSEGVFLLVCRNGRAAEKLLCKNGLACSLIGQITPHADRILFSGEEVRHLNIPRKSDLADLKRVLKKRNSDNDFSLA
ncbi:MAG: hypothetical protein K6E18_10335 [Lachnospiraceae bacterium]|nr:hypothetical protein [Lachnospiraceae bacterium]